MEICYGNYLFYYILIFSAFFRIFFDIFSTFSSPSYQIWYSIYFYWMPKSSGIYLLHFSIFFHIFSYFFLFYLIFFFAMFLHFLSGSAAMPQKGKKLTQWPFWELHVVYYGGGWLDWQVILMSWFWVKVSIESNCWLRTESNQIKIDIWIPLAVGSRFCGCFV